MKTLKEIKAVPEDRGYKKAVKNFTSHRLKVCPKEQDWELNEKKLNYGQVEEAPNELTLIGNMISPYLTFFPPLHKFRRYRPIILLCYNNQYLRYLLIIMY